MLRSTSDGFGASALIARRHSGPVDHVPVGFSEDSPNYPSDPEDWCEPQEQDPNRGKNGRRLAGFHARDPKQAKSTSQLLSASRIQARCAKDLGLRLPTKHIQPQHRRVEEPCLRQSRHRISRRRQEPRNILKRIPASAQQMSTVAHLCASRWAPGVMVERLGATNLLVERWSAAVFGYSLWLRLTSGTRLASFLTIRAPALKNLIFSTYGCGCGWSRVWVLAPIYSSLISLFNCIS